MIVSAPVMLAFVRHRLQSPGRLALLGALLGFPLLMAAAMPAAGLAGFSQAGFAAVIVAAGLIGQDVSAGTLQLLLARPVTRAAYVTSKWLAASGLSLVLLASQGLLGAIVLTARGNPPGGQDLLLYLGHTLFLTVGATAVVVLFSSLLSGLGDVVLLGALHITMMFANTVADAKGWTVLARTAFEVERFLSPVLPLGSIVAGQPSWFAITSYASTVALTLALAIIVLNRKELSYASG